jgi:hypothetical protein
MGQSLPVPESAGQSLNEGEAHASVGKQAKSI